MSIQSTISAVETADLATARAAAEVEHHPVTKTLGRLSEVADQPPMFALAALLLAGGVLSGHRQVAEAGGRMLLAVGIATAAKSAVKQVVARTRPYVLAREGRYESGLMGPVEKDWNSFPSGHTADAVAAARAVARALPEARLPAYGVAAAVAAIQVPRCAHYPSDVTAGALIGRAAEMAADRIWAQVGEPLAVRRPRE